MGRLVQWEAFWRLGLRLRECLLTIEYAGQPIQGLGHLALLAQATQAVGSGFSGVTAGRGEQKSVGYDAS